MFGTTFKHDTIRKYVILFGTLFNDLYVTREDENGASVQNIKVPLSYGPKEKILSRLSADPELENTTAITLPRISFEMIDIQYAPDRKRNKMNRVAVQSSKSDESVTYQYEPVPFNISFNLYVMVRNAQDGTRIVEQILPYFTPEWTATINLVPEMGGTYDIPTILQGISQDDQYEGNFETRRSLIWTLNFTMKGWIFGPTKESKIIKQAEIDFRLSRTIDTTVANSVVITTYPGLTANGEPTSNASIAVDYTDVLATDNYGFITDFEENY